MNDNQAQNANNGINSIQIGNTVVTPVKPVVPGQSVAQATVVQPQVQQPQVQQPQVQQPQVQQPQVAPTQPQVQPQAVAQTVPVQPQVQQPQTVAQTTPVQPQPASPAESPFFTPVSVQPEVSVSPALPEIAPVQTTPVEATPAQVQTTPITQEVSTEQQVDNNGVEVIATAPKSKASNIVLFIFLILLILFVFNIDTVISMYNQFRDTKTIPNPISKNTNNLTEGFILINDNTSSIRLKDIKFYNFRKSQGKGITFSYEALAKYEDPASLEIYAELYNSEKEILYKELFDPKQKIEKDTVRTYTMSADEDTYNDAFYALVKIYSDKEKQSVSTLTCSLDDENYSYKTIYNFTNNGLTTYQIEKTLKNNTIEENNNDQSTEEEKTDNEQSNVDEKLSKEYEEIKDITNATFENNTLKYTIDLNKDNGDYVELYDKDTTPTIIKNKEISKEWKCE